MSNFCPICLKSSQFLINHKLLNHSIFKCDSCNYSFVDCSNFSKDTIISDQLKGKSTFGKNVNRNLYYLEKLQSILHSYEIKSLLEIGTPEDFGFLRNVHLKYPQIKLFSHDILKNDLPEYITFYESISHLNKNTFDLLFCIHTLEHIPTNQLIDFILICQKISKYFIFEVPHCPTLDRILESSNHTPHYSFFTKTSIFKLFGENLNVEIDKKVMRFSNLKK